MLDDKLFSGRRLCVVGNINRDVKISPIKPDGCLLRDGETSTPFVVETIGGGGANSAVIAAHLGAQVVFAGRTGCDALGRQLEKALAGWGVAPRLHKDRRGCTGTSIALAFTNGHRHFVSALPNNEALRFADLDLSVLKAGWHLLRADLWFSRHMLFGGNQRLLRRAKEAGMAVSIDLNWDPQWGVAPRAEIRRRKEAVRELLPLVDLAHGNIRELNEFAECRSLPLTLKRLASWGLRAAVVHCGADGSGYCEDGVFTTAPAVPARRLVNTTGTGDVLSVCMMLLHGRAGLSVREKLGLANRIVAE
ncbi:MAG: carbohydrate kinase family protein, partial [Planctomycetota bacterium]